MCTATPQFVELNDFMFRDKFVGLSDTDLLTALQIVNAQFSGVYTLWSFLPPDDAYAKRRLCINYLVAWKLMQTYPEKAVGAAGTGL